jgi:ketol-acid reductoisomerase
MLVGYNTNVSYKNKVYHIQTEDSGRNNPVIVTLLYSSGAILSSKKTSYSHLADDSDFKEKVKEMMREQHKSMIKDLLAGKYSGEHQGENEEAGAEEKETREFQESQSAGEIQETGEEPVEAGPGDISAMPAQPEATAVTKEQITKSLDDILLNFIMKRAKQ